MRRMKEGTVFTGVCLLTFRGGGTLSFPMETEQHSEHLLRGLPLAFTQEDFLVVTIFNLDSISFRRQRNVLF